MISNDRTRKTTICNRRVPRKSSAAVLALSAITAAEAGLATPHTLDELWDQLDKAVQSDDLYSIDDAVFLTEAEELRFWAMLEAESADCGECRSP